MLLTIDEARKILGQDAEKYSDSEMEYIIDFYYALSNIAIDCYLESKNDKRKDKDPKVYISQALDQLYKKEFSMKVKNGINSKKRFEQG